MRIRGATWLFGAVTILSVGSGCRCNGDMREQPDAPATNATAPTTNGSATHAAPAASKLSTSVEIRRRSHILSAGHGSSCVIVAGDIHCWGLPLGPKDGGRLTRVEPTGMRFEHVSRGNIHVCARTSGGEVWCAGGNSDGELGVRSTESCPLTPYRDGTVDSYPCSGSFTRVPGLPAVKDVIVGSHRTCSITEEGDVFCWGAVRESRDLGLHSIPPTKLQRLSNVARLALGSFFSCALRIDGTVWCWGSNQEGQLGRGTVDRDGHNEPMQVDGLSGVIEIGAGANFACALSIDGTDQQLRCWGANLRGQIGSAAPCTKDLCPQPVRVELPVGVGNVRELALGGQTTCVLYEDGSLYCLGRLASDIAGNGLRRAPGIPPMFAVANGGTHLVGISGRGSVLTWGDRTLLAEEAHRIRCDKCVMPLIQVPGLKVDVH